MVKQLTETQLYKKLKTGYEGADAAMAEKIIGSLERLCGKASDRMKKSVSLHKEYTLHDEVHLVRVTELMAMILGEDGVNALNPIEIMLLILSAYYHDIGMVLEDSDINNLNNNQEYLTFRENWKVNHPSYKETLQQMRRSKNSDIVERCANVIYMLDASILTEYIRINHGSLSRKIIEQEALNKDLWEIEEVGFSYLLSKIAESHTLSIAEISDLKKYPVDERYLSYNINVQYLCVILRLADILDFDKERTPDELYRTISFTNSISIQEWEKHRSVLGWEISDSIIRFTAHCTHPAYQRTIYKFMDYIEDELVQCHELVRNFPKRLSAYQLNIPVRVNRDGIRAKNNAYLYHDLEISISRDEIVKLLMMDELYEDRCLCIRELLQNSLDALRHRKSLFQSVGIPWEAGKVTFRQYVDEFGRINLECQDNGIGMDERIVSSYLTKAGRSYYKSPEFEQVRLELRKKGIDFNPCSQFGIGFMSCFMLGDKIHIHTRRDYGEGKAHGTPLIIEMNGISGILLIKEGEQSQPVGTTVRIIGKEKPGYFDKRLDKVRLLDVLNGYALKCEFPIEARCEIEEIQGECTIVPHTLVNKTILEVPKLENSILTYEYDMNQTNCNLHGNMRVSFLKDKEGKIALKNDRAELTKLAEYGRFVFQCGEEVIDVDFKHCSSICCDGILVCGLQGRDRDKNGFGRRGMRANIFSLGNVSYVADIRGDLKPRLTPARAPKANSHYMHPSWRLVESELQRAWGRLWELVFDDLRSQQELITGMILATIYDFRFKYLPEDVIYYKLFIPILEAGKMSWRKLSDIDKFEVTDGKLRISDTQELEVAEKISYYMHSSHGISLRKNIIAAIMIVSCLVVENGRTYLYMKKPYEIRNVQDVCFIKAICAMSYAANMDRYLSIVTGYKTVNRNHPLMKCLLPEIYWEELSPLASFVKALIFFVTNEDNIKDIKEGQKSMAQKRLGCYYLEVNWQEYEDVLADDYRIWMPGYGDVVITKDMLKAWAEYKNLE